MTFNLKQTVLLAYTPTILTKPFVVILSTSIKMLDHCLKIGYNCFFDVFSL